MDMAKVNAQLIADAPLILEELIHYKKLYEYRVERFREDRAEIERLREAILEFADYLEEKVTPYMTNDMHEVVPIGGMVSDLHKMIKGDD